ncbi:hypothetical protein SLNSH_04115 [Alsobacter soli]|uniref:Uncharacterized protein n=2 Tax=Alsobacter soli TaxID=2109933 RepID=A0A2T1HXQ2_9HYPH|nr:hypothetical protein SLNSH_04115 [Alsobacter soli]
MNPRQAGWAGAIEERSPGERTTMQPIVPETAPSGGVDLALPLFAMKIAFGFTLFSLEITQAMVRAAAGDKKAERE